MTNATNGLQPEFRVAIGCLNVHVHASFLAAVEEKPVRTFAIDGRHEKIIVENQPFVTHLWQPLGIASPIAHRYNRHMPQSTLPTGTVTFLFTDIEGSTKLAQTHPAEWEASRQRHDTILRAACETHRGHVFQVVGDAFCVAFATTPDALAAALAAQRALHSTLKNQESTVIKVRMGLHTGEAEARDGGYQGYITLSRTQRLMSAASGGQVLISSVSEGLLRDRLPAGVTLHDLGALQLKDFPRAETVYQLVTPDLPAQFPPLKSLRAVPNNLPVQLTSFIGRE